MMNLKSVINKAADIRHGLQSSSQACTNKNYAVTPCFYLLLFMYHWRMLLAKLHRLSGSSGGIFDISFQKATMKNSVGYPIQAF